MRTIFANNWCYFYTCAKFGSKRSWPPYAFVLTCCVLHHMFKKLAALRKISAFSHDMGGATMEVMLSLYKARVISLMLHSYHVQCSTKETSKLNKVQNQALIKSSGARTKSSTASLGVLCNIPLLHLKLQQNLIHTFIQVFCHPNSYHLKGIINTLLHNNTHSNQKITNLKWHRSNYVLH